MSPQLHNWQIHYEAGQSIPIFIKLSYVTKAGSVRNDKAIRAGLAAAGERMTVMGLAGNEGGQGICKEFAKP
jgi:hypothetical protein